LERVFYRRVLVHQQETALDFYTNVLGLEKRVENPAPNGPRFLTVGVKGDDFRLCSGPALRGRPNRRWDTPSVDHDRDRRLPEDGPGG
jgi:catechol 2,3-dioxygenase-like lactoylglutathione lyase family enzyme